MSATRRFKDSHPTLIDVAQLAGFSPTTISRVLQGGDESAKKSRKQAMRLAVVQLGNAPSDIARSTRTNRSSTLIPVPPDVGNT